MNRVTNVAVDNDLAEQDGDYKDADENKIKYCDIIDLLPTKFVLGSSPQKSWCASQACNNAGRIFHFHQSLILAIDIWSSSRRQHACLMDNNRTAKTWPLMSMCVVFSSSMNLMTYCLLLNTIRGLELETNTIREAATVFMFVSIWCFICSLPNIRVGSEATSHQAIQKEICKGQSCSRDYGNSGL